MHKNIKLQTTVFILLSVLAMAFSFSACDRNVAEKEDYPHEELLQELGSNFLMPWLEGFVLDVEALQQSIEKMTESLPVGNSAAETEKHEKNLGEAREAWRIAMSQWQKLELLQSGPLGTSFGAIGGQNLRDRIYSWPLVNACRVDQEIVKKSYDSSDFTKTDSINILGLDALEYLLFYGEPENHCASQLDINSHGSWDALETTELLSRRISYALKLAEMLIVDAKKAQAAFALSGDKLDIYDFSNGRSSLYENSAEAVQEVFNGLFYIEQYTKDQKVLSDKGILKACAAGECTQKIESPWSKHTSLNIYQNLIALQSIYYSRENAAHDEEDAVVGTERAVHSFADYYALKAGKDAHEKFRRALTEAVTIMSGILLEDSKYLTSAKNLSTETKDEVLEKLKAVVEIMKNDISLALSLTIPAAVDGDND